MELKLQVKDIIYYQFSVISPNINDEELESKIKMLIHEAFFKYKEYFV